MADTVIRVDGLGKRYRIGANRQELGLRHILENGVKRLGKYLTGSSMPSTAYEDFWALKNVSLDITRGECVGVIGRNGAGKSTLLKILSRITEPTEGAITIKGRVASLLEVGTGFHPELTGRENIFLNGAILGMKRKETVRRFDEIVAFAEVEKFLDTPVKYYSSGMYVRLAFAVAAHLEPEILIVDEVLAVGDSAFQKKCLSKMEDVGNQGRTILVVSHSMVTVNAICSRVICLRDGRVIKEGPASTTIAAYIASGINASGQASWPSPDKAPGNENVRLRSVRIVSEGHVTDDVAITEDVDVEIDFWSMRDLLNVHVSIHLLDKYGIRVLCSGIDGIGSKPGLHRARCVLPGNFLNDGLYSISVYLLTDVTRLQLHLEQVVSFTVHDTGEDRGSYLGEIIGTVRVRLPWDAAFVARLDEDPLLAEGIVKG